MRVIDLDNLTAESTLPSGVLLKINGNSPLIAEDYTKEISDLLSNPDSGKPRLPFVNQDQPFMEILRALSTQYPFVIVRGDYGTGKSMMIDYILKVITGKVTLDEVDQVFPSAKPYFEKIITKLKEFEHRDFLLYPDFKKQSVITAIPYFDDQKGVNDTDYLDAFYKEVAQILNRYANDPLKNIKREFEKDEFERFCSFEADTLMLNFYSHIANAKTSMATGTSISFIELHADSLDKIGGTWTLNSAKTIKNEKDQYLSFLTGQDRSSKFNPDELQTLLDTEGIKKFFYTQYGIIADKIRGIDVKTVPDEKKEEIFLNLFFDRINYLKDYIQDKYNHTKITEDKHVPKEILMLRGQIYPKMKVAQHTVDEVLSTLASVKEAYLKDRPADVITKVIETTIDYFRNNSRILENSLTYILRNRSDVYLTSPKNEQEDFDMKQMFLPFGLQNYSVDDLLDVNYLGTKGSTNADPNFSALTSLQIKDIFLKFETPLEPEDKLDDGPPHTRILELGEFFQMGILAIEDRFEDYIKKLAQSDGDNKFTMEQFLSYLQTQQLKITYDGVTFEFPLPKMILGATAERDAFVTIEGMYVIDQGGARDRFTQVETNSTLSNTKEVREGTIRVILDSLKKINEDRTQKSFKFTDEAINMFLRNTINAWDECDLAYRGLDHQIQNLCAFSEGWNRYDIDVDIIKKWWASNIKDDFFSTVDSSIVTGRYFPKVQSQVGTVYGLAVYENNQACPYPVKSNLMSDRLKSPDEPIFNLRDINCQMASKDTMKGYYLATDYIRMLLDHYLGDKLKKGWQLTTFFSESWLGTSGPSASNAMAISMLSALADEPIFSNRFYTGTIDPSNIAGNITADSAGRVGMIGGTYYKGLVPYRIKVKTGSDRPFYFQFPTNNLNDFTKDMVFDTFGLDEKVSCIPTEDFFQGYFFATCSEEITVGQIKDCNHLANENMEKTMDKVRRKIDSYNTSRFWFF